MATNNRAAGTDPFVSLAVQTIEAHVQKRPQPDCDKSNPLFESRHGAFVSIHTKDGCLRGCIGTILPTKDTLYEEIIANAKSASTRDPRFPEITPDELSDLVINVDVLSEPEQVNGLDALDPKKYGVIVANNGRMGVLLPDLEGVDTVEEQVSIAMQKAGIAAHETIELHRFTVERHI